MATKLSTEKVKGKMKIGHMGICFICAERKILVPGHKVCPEHHDEKKCHTCNPKKVKTHGRV